MAGHRSGKHAALWLRWIARGLGTLVAGFWVLIGVLEAIAGSDPWTAESNVLATLIVAAALAVAAAWWREGIGGFLILLVGAAHFVFAFVAAGTISSLPWRSRVSRSCWWVPCSWQAGCFLGGRRLCRVSPRAPRALHFDIDIV